MGSSAGAATHEEIGDRISLLSGPTTFPAGEPFHIRHGWPVIEEPTPPAIGIYSFALDVDGVPRAPDFVIRETIPPTAFDTGTAIQLRTWVFNFPDGMTGVHTFTGHWFEPCARVVELHGYPGPCKDPAEGVEEETHSLTVTFTP